jgi:protocatechuate 4,5-dioxygenase beta chain
MGAVVGGVGCSHAPVLAALHDSGRAPEGVWADLMDGFARTKTWLDQLGPDLAVVVYNDHFNHFFLDNYPTFALGVATQYPLADEGRAKRRFDSLPGDSAFGWRVAEHLLAAEFDPSICQEMAVDHGVLAALPLLLPTPWTVPILPLAVNVIRHPLPSPRRCHRLGQAIRGAVEAEAGDRRVVVIATGGLSHHLQGPDFGWINPEWDHRFLDLLTEDAEALRALGVADLARLAGADGVEMMMWLVMRGALSAGARCVERRYCAPALTGLAVIAFEERWAAGD